MIIALLAAETLLLVVVLVLVAGLLRSHAEILRRLGPADDRVEPPLRAAAGAAAPPLTGTTPRGDAVSFAFERGAAPTLLAFLTSGCTACQTFWGTLGERRLPAGVELLIVTHGRERERPAKLRELAPPAIPVVMSSAAWAEYRVPGAPYFVLVDRTVRGEGVASTWDALSSLIGDALEDERDARDGSDGPSRARRIDDTLAAAGIGPEHPSLYPGKHPLASPGEQP